MVSISDAKQETNSLKMLLWRISGGFKSIVSNTLVYHEIYTAFYISLMMSIG